MSRGLTDEPEAQPQSQDNEMDAIINELIKGQNKLHDRLVDLERKADHACKCGKHNQSTEANSEQEAAERKFWKKGL